MARNGGPIVLDADSSWLDGFAAKRGTRHLCAFSRGKDAIAAFLVARARSIDLTCVHMHVVPGLEFVAESLAKLERALGVKIIDVPHPSLLRMLKNCTFQPPERVNLIDDLRLKVPTYSQVYADARKLTGAPAGCLVASGVRAADSIVRRISFVKHGAVRAKTETFYPVWNFNKAATLDVIKRAGVELPVDYAWFGRSFDGIDARFLVPLKQHAPRDYQRVLEVFPLAELEVFRHGLSRS